ncbi:MAG TPA: RtcB family protein [Anaerohalosphaeraceae bacterium]|nr:RtcB family protein [Phycisphaerae bacterium]HOK95634.1 RtcB family protein [Anaerohalosphaeraceae bacterium]HOM75523.1 RtcB family protein [Anaerohalosphaeraceae bacterium]HPC64728.1 RtcB family protein [Anaerohalosphaeraceae bacterium]HPO70001.1 RtcB family protein [Anaerohalosphaeraceae bacterium]
MDRKLVKRRGEYIWLLERSGPMHVDGIIFASEELISQMDDMVAQQVRNVASLPGIVEGSFAMPDAHWGYGFCIGGVAAFDPQEGGIISAGGVGFDIACGVRTLHTGLKEDQLQGLCPTLAESLFRHIPAGVGSTGSLRLTKSRLDEVLAGGARWAVENGFGDKDDLRFIEAGGCIHGADPACVSDEAKKRQLEEMGTLGSGNHYLEIQKVVEIYDKPTAEAFGIQEGDIKVSIHCGSRGLGHQIGTDYLKKMAQAAKQHHINLPERELACAPLSSSVGRQYLGAMRSGINCALANRQILTHLVREVFEQVCPKADIRLLYDVSHNTCQEEEHPVDGTIKKLFVHRKGATRAWGPGRSELPSEYRPFGQPVLIGGTMGTSSYILAGTAEGRRLAFESACHGAGRSMSRNAATKQYNAKDIIGRLAHQGVLIRSRSMRGIAEEAPQAYKDVSQVVEATHRAGLARKVAKLIPLVCVKG